MSGFWLLMAVVYFAVAIREGYVAVTHARDFKYHMEPKHFEACIYWATASCISAGLAAVYFPG